jgi:two-component system, NarL family, sensor histidine kinase LiaS
MVVMGVAPEDAVSAGTSMEKALLPEERPLRDSALRGVTDPQMLSARLSHGASSAIVPILNRNGGVAGLMMSRIRRPFVASELFRNTVRGLPIKILVVTPCAALFGLIFGALAARGLTRRIERLGAAAHEWGRGTFAITADEPTPDELGQLVKQLNRMAGDVHELLVLRQQMAAVDERHRLARELHDTVKQEIFAATMQISAARGLVDADSRTVASRLDEAQKTPEQRTARTDGSPARASTAARTRRRIVGENQRVRHQLGLAEQYRGDIRGRGCFVRVSTGGAWLVSHRARGTRERCPS